MINLKTKQKDSKHLKNVLELQGKRRGSLFLCKGMESGIPQSKNKRIYFLISQAPIQRAFPQNSRK
jgi:hypothetical protein